MRAARKTTHNMGQTALLSFAASAASVKLILRSTSDDRTCSQRPAAEERPCTMTYCMAMTRVHVWTGDILGVALQPLGALQRRMETAMPPMPTKTHSMASARRVLKRTKPLPRLPSRSNLDFISLASSMHVTLIARTVWTSTLSTQRERKICAQRCTSPASWEVSVERSPATAMVAAIAGTSLWARAPAFAALARKPVALEWNSSEAVAASSTKKVRKNWIARLIMHTSGAEGPMRPRFSQTSKGSCMNVTPTSTTEMPRYCTNVKAVRKPAKNMETRMPLCPGSAGALTVERVWKSMARMPAPTVTRKPVAFHHCGIP
mmetsp:Transcript_15252/g.42121  ORF Transcript_15252/g.42121 Transcript_15252/m.42121 type:complete len:319 (+) Transcript_15252:421-1377(+)